MAKGGKQKKHGGKDDTSRAQLPNETARKVTSGLRTLLHRLEARLGLFPDGSGHDWEDRFRAPVLLAANAEVPENMRRLFDEDIRALERLGKDVGQCHRMNFGAASLYCLPYYYFDGFNALLYLEQADSMVLAWKAQEMEGDASPGLIHALGTADDTQSLLLALLESNR